MRSLPREPCGDCMRLIAIGHMHRHKCGSRIRMRPAVNYVAVYIAHYGPPPWVCTFCSTSVHSYGGRRKNSGMIHHLDGDPFNNAVENLAPAHFGCHSTHHRLEDPEHTVNMRKGLVNRDLVALSKKVRVAWSDPELLEQQRLRSTANMSRPDVIKKVSDGVKAAWDALTPEAREERNAKLRGPRKRATCECGKITTVGRMAKHLAASGHQLAQTEDEQNV